MINHKRFITPFELQSILYEGGLNICKRNKVVKDMGGNGIVSGIHVLSTWIMRIAIINFLWFVLNLPIIAFGYFLLLAVEQSVVIVLALLIFVLAPFLLFPSTAAVFSSVRNWFIDKDDHLPVARDYMKFYKENFKKSVLVGLILTFVWAIWIVDYYYFSQENIILMTLFLMMGIGLFVFTINYFSVNAHYNLSIFLTLKHTLVITLGRPVSALLIVISSALILYTSLGKVQPIFPFFSISLIAFISFSSFYRHYLKVKEQLN
jgi:uncharacterized membrane protein YesL